MFDTEGSSGGEGVDGEIDGGGAMRVPAAPLAAVRAGLVFLRYNRGLAAVQELKHEKENFIADGVHGYDLASLARSERVEAGVRPAEEFPEEGAAGGQNAAVGVDEAAFDAEGDIAEGLAVDEEVEVV